MNDQHDGVEVASWPVMTALLAEDGSGTVEISGVSQEIDEPSLDRARAHVQERAIEYARDKLQRPLHLRTEDRDGTWDLVVHPSGRIEEMEAPQPARGRLLGRLASPTPAATAADEPPREPVELSTMRVTVTGREPDHGPAPAPSPALAADAPRRIAEERPVDVPPAPPPRRSRGPARQAGSPRAARGGAQRL